MPVSDIRFTSGRYARTASQMDDVRSELHAVKDDLMRLRHDMASLASRGVDVVRSGADDTLEHGRRAAQSAKKYYQGACDYAAEHPMVALMLAVGVGAIAARMLRRY